MMFATSSIILPLLVVLIASGTTAAILVLSDSLRKARKIADRAPRCPCGYNLTGNISGTCPECGKQTDSKLL